MASHRVTADQLNYWSQLYGTQWRQLRRWIDIGLRNNDPCPLGNPAAMPGWWSRRYRNRKVPLKLEHPAHVPQNKFKQEKKMSNIDPPIDLDRFDPKEGEELLNIRRLAASIYARLASLPANAPNSSHLHTQYTNACNTISILKRRHQEDQANLGKFIPREIYERDATSTADQLRQMHDSMIRKIIEKCYELSTEHQKLVTAAAKTVLDAQARIFERLTKFTTADELLTELSA